MEFSFKQFKKLIDESECVQSGKLKVFDNMEQFSVFGVPLIATADGLFEFKYYILTTKENIKFINLVNDENIEVDKMGKLCGIAIFNIQNRHTNLLKPNDECFYILLNGQKKYTIEIDSETQKSTLLEY